MLNEGLIDVGQCTWFSVQVVGLLVDHPGLEEALSGGVGTGVNHTSLSPINGMTSRVSMFC